MRIVWHAKITERFKDAEPCVHTFTGDYDTGGEWVSQSEALRAVGMACWNFLDAANEGGQSDEFEIALGLTYVKDTAS